MLKTIIALIPFAIFCLLGANLYVEYLIDKQFDKIEEELFKEQNNGNQTRKDRKVEEGNKYKKNVVQTK